MRSILYPYKENLMPSIRKSLVVLATLIGVGFVSKLILNRVISEA